MKQIGKLIGRRKYEALKALDLENLTEDTLTAFNLQFKNLTVGEALKMISEYETEYNHTGLSNKSVSEYFNNINQPKPEKEINEMTKEWLWKRFTNNFLMNEKVPFSQDADSLENVKPLFYYFIGNEVEFKKCANVSKVSEPSLKKGLLIIGGYGNGKTAVMKAFEKSLLNTNIRFKGYTANAAVTMFESCSSAPEKDEFNRKMRTGTLYFDDVLTEREASNYGKSDLFKEIIEERYSRRKRTYITCNYKDGTNNDIDEGLAQFGARYGSRVYDRLFDMFNVVEFTGKSFRK